MEGEGVGGRGGGGWKGTRLESTGSAVRIEFGRFVLAFQLFAE